MDCGARLRAGASGHGWDLASITSAEENAFVITLFPGSLIADSYYWLGAKRTVAAGPFAWLSGETFDYAAWWPGEPNNYQAEDYLTFYTNGAGSWGWNDAPDNGWGNVRGFVAERARGHGGSRTGLTRTAGVGTCGGSVGASPSAGAALSPLPAPSRLGTAHRGR